jgi:transposase
MQDHELYEQILGITLPWQVVRVELKLEESSVHVYLGHGSAASWSCPECQQPCPLHDHEPERTWRHLDTCQDETVLHAQLPRTNCAVHGVRVVRVPWALPGSRFTLLFEGLAIAWLREASQRAVATRLGLTWNEVHGIMQRAVRRGLERRAAEPLRHLGVDEKSFRKRHRYATLVNDLERGRVLYVEQDRKQSSLDGFWESLKPEQKQSIEAVAMDMWEPYVASTRAHLQRADEKIVYDKFHVARHLGEAVDQVRRQENKQLRGVGDERLVGTKYDWLSGRDRFDAAQWRRFGELRRSNLKTARAWALKEQAMPLWEYESPGWARKHFGWWYRWATHGRLKPMVRVAQMLKERIGNVLSYVTHGITNALSESLNAQIQWVKYTARGFRNWDNFAAAIYFHCGGLDLSPK